MASMVEPAELSGCVGLGADAVVVGAEVVSETELDPAEPLELKSGKPCPSDPVEPFDDADGTRLKGGSVVADPAAKSGSATANSRD